ncbi:MAG TPA: RluA family pseudouridine synthase, partial [Desulfuromonadales bacterium]|nr:RluA family pseudouridine synthase [Desulfuromonadales bacterium]
MIEWLISEIEAGLLPLPLLHQRLPQAPESYLRQLLRSGRIRLGGAPLDPSLPLAAGTRLRLPASRRLKELALPSPTILFENDELLAVDKPAGLAVHRGVGHEDDNLLKRVEILLARRGVPYKVAPAHRLDAETSGPVLFGKGRKACARLGHLFMSDQVEKTYLALVAGRLPDAGLFEGAVPVRGRAKQAATAYRLLDYRQNASMLELKLRTGRTHQIRRHLAAAGHPLVGDRRYRGPNLEAGNRMFLHCFEITLPVSPEGEKQRICSPLPPELEQLLK